MPLKSGSSRATVSSNIKELVTHKPGKIRAKAIKTIMQRTGDSEEVAKRKQAVAIAISKAGKSKRA